jgi:hypothetical protein
VRGECWDREEYFLPKQSFQVRWTRQLTVAAQDRLAKRSIDPNTFSPSRSYEVVVLAAAGAARPYHIAKMRAYARWAQAVAVQDRR